MTSTSKFPASMTVDQVRAALDHERMAWRHMPSTGPVRVGLVDAVRLHRLRITSTGRGLMARVGAR